MLAAMMFHRGFLKLGGGVLFPWPKETLAQVRSDYWPQSIRQLDKIAHLFQERRGFCCNIRLGRA